MDNYFFETLATKALNMSPHPDPRFPPSIYYRFLQVLAKELKPTLSVELGVCGGGASFHLCKGWDRGIVAGVDHANDYPENMNFILGECKNFRLIRADSVASAADIYRKYGMIDILFIDTTHTYEQTMAEYNAYKDFLSYSSVVCLDDLKRPGMDQAWDEISGNKIRLDSLHVGTEGGFGVIF